MENTGEVNAASDHRLPKTPKQARQQGGIGVISIFDQHSAALFDTELLCVAVRLSPASAMEYVEVLDPAEHFILTHRES